MSEVARLPRRDADALDDVSLPGWVYHDPEYFRVEMARLIRPSWQIVCHASDIAERRRLADARSARRERDRDPRRATASSAPSPMSAATAARGCVDGEAGCAKRLTCPYHAWTYAADGRLVGVPSREDYPGLDPASLGLIPVELETWRGFLFVRLEGGGPSVAAMMAPYEAEVAPYRFEELRAIGRITLRPRDVNWKNVADNYSDGLHINVAHPGLTRLFGGDYRDRGRRACRPDVGRAGRTALRQPLRARLSAFPARGRGAALALFQALAERRDRHLSRPGRFHAFRAGRADRRR